MAPRRTLRHAAAAAAIALAAPLGPHGGVAWAQAADGPHPAAPVASSPGGAPPLLAAPATALAAAPVAPAAPAASDPRYAALPALVFRAINTREQLRVRIYRADGTLDPSALAGLAHLLRDLATGTDSPVVPRTLQLLVRIANHFGAEQIEVVSAYRSGMRPDGRRARREGYHGVGSAIDFRMPGVESVRVAAYARTFAHVGVGYYPREGFVHLDSREQSFFWESLARRHHHGWNRPLDRADVAARDASWTAADDAPWDPPGAAVALVLHPRTQPGAHRHAAHHRHAHARPPLRVFHGAPAE